MCVFLLFPALNEFVLHLFSLVCFHRRKKRPAYEEEEEEKEEEENPSPLQFAINKRASPLTRASLPASASEEAKRERKRKRRKGKRKERRKRKSGGN